MQVTLHVLAAKRLQAEIPGIPGHWKGAEQFSTFALKGSLSPRKWTRTARGPEADTGTGDCRQMTFCDNEDIAII